MTSSLYMLRLDPEPLRVARWMTAQGVERHRDDGGYGWHALLTAAFGKHAPKPFRWFEPVPGAAALQQQAHLLGYTAADEATLRNHASQFADPAVCAAVGLDALAIKQMPATFSRGQCFGFEVRVRPTVRQDRHGDRKKSRERDAFLVAVEKAGPRDDRDDLDRATVYRNWLERRLEQGGAKVINAQVLALRRARLSRRDHAEPRQLVAVGGNGGGGPDAIFTGTLTVADPTEFSRLLSHGVGRHRSFGFGMLLLKPGPGD